MCTRWDTARPRSRDVRCSRRLQNLINSTSYVDPTHLQFFLTNNVMLCGANNPLDCCIIAFHSASEVNGHGLGSTHSNGNAVVQTYGWGSYVTPGFVNPRTAWSSPG